MNWVKEHQAKEKELSEKYGPDFGNPALVFSVNTAEQGVINEWVESLRSEIMELQKKSAVSDLAEADPYYGAIGGGLTYSFSPTGLGMIITVKETITGKELNVTNALDWHFFG
jgi:hypothetical protein